MDSHSFSHQLEAASSPEPMALDATASPVASPGSTGQKRSPSPTNDEPSKRAKTHEDSAESSDGNQQLNDENEEPGADVADQAEEVPEVIESPDSDTEDATRIYLPYGFPPIDPDKMQELRDWLDIHASVEGDSQVATGLHTQLLKSMEPGQQDLEAICRMMGIDTNGINWREGIHIPGVMEDGLKARPHQISGANWISTTLESPLRAALFADECGTGKTVQIGLALAIHYYRIKAEVEAGTFRPRDERRRFKPSLILCPPDLAYQTFREWCHWFPGFFNIRICHRTKVLAGDHLTRQHVMDHKHGLQDWVDENASSHEDIETLRNIAIVPYHTAMRRMIIPKEKEPATEAQNDGENQNNQNNDNEGAGQARHRRQRKKGKPGRKRGKAVAKPQLDFKVTGQSYNWIICDDVYPIRGPRPTTHKLIHQLEHEATLWPFVYKPSPSSRRPGHEHDPRRYFDRRTWQAIRSGGAFRGLDIDSVVQRIEFIGPHLPRDQLMKEEYTAYIQEGKGPLFLMNPDLFQKFRDEIKSLRPEIAGHAIAPLLKMFCLRRGMLTPSIMPDGTTVVPGEGIPSMHIRTVVLQPFDDEDKKEIYQVCKKHYPRLFQDANEEDEDIGSGTIDKATLTWINPAELRTLGLSTTNVEFYPLTQKKGSDGKTSFLNSKEVQKLMSSPPRFDRLQSFSLPGAAAPSAAADSENDEDNRSEDGVGGLRWYFREMQKARGRGGPEKFPTDREDIPKTFCSRSAKLCWTINRVLELKEQGKRVLIFVNHPLTSVILIALLTSLCVKTLNIRSKHDVDQRAHMVRQFNNANAENGAEALVMSFQLGGFGLNLHGACHHGIIVEYPENLPTMLHSFGRLWRMGQEHEVHWDVLYLESSFDGWTETRMVSKYADILAAEGQIPDEIQEEYRIIYAFELIKRYLGQDCNRYPRLRVTWAEQDHALIAREGHFYSAVANYLMQNPTHTIKFLRRRLSAIARRWTPEHGDLTLDMIEGRSPELGDGVMLDSRNPDTPGYIAVPAGDDLQQGIEQAAEIQANLNADWMSLDRERRRRV
ncbi:hypothetical protein FPANT_11454 [Fusarium pseudoanthophilum]|uniref:Helicase C-terminal domain-containing protein n=1 Tax=Fusarium pseudoanthophilum TaxID=48495 RepID=A0A8H5KL12_9HYPO|nr:hypothetical protein FPANT_11454 [Fusarium pseudoanthophilum]